MGIAPDPAQELALKIDVLRDLEESVRELMESHERKREVWMPSDLMAPLPTGRWRANEPSMGSPR